MRRAFLLPSSVGAIGQLILTVVGQVARLAPASDDDNPSCGVL
jgi:hypothetical protein